MVLRQLNGQPHGSTASGAATEFLFGQAIFKRMVGQDDDPPAHGKGVDGRGEGPRPGRKFVVDFDPQGLKGPLCRVSPGALGGGGYCRCKDLDELSRTNKGVLGPGPDDGRGDAAREPFLAVLPQDAREVALGIRVEHLGGTDSARLVHPHVEWTVKAVREPAIGFIELQGGNPEVEEHPGNGPDSPIGEDLRQLVIDGRDEFDPIGVCREPRPGAHDRLRIAVESNEPSSWARIEQRLGVPAHPQGAVDNDRPGLAERRG